MDVTCEKGTALRLRVCGVIESVWETAIQSQTHKLMMTVRISLLEQMSNL